MMIFYNKWIFSQSIPNFSVFKLSVMHTFSAPHDLYEGG